MSNETESSPDSERSLSKGKVFFIALFGYVIASTGWSCWRVFVLDRHSKWVSDGTLIIASLLGSIPWGLGFLALPILASFTLNQHIEGLGQGRSTVIRSLILGIIGGFFMGGLLINEGSSKLLKFILLYAAFFALALFAFARRPDGRWVVPPRNG